MQNKGRVDTSHVSCGREKSSLLLMEHFLPVVHEGYLPTRRLTELNAYPKVTRTPPKATTESHFQTSIISNTDQTLLFLTTSCSKKSRSSTDFGCVSAWPWFLCWFNSSYYRFCYSHYQRFVSDHHFTTK